MAKISGKTDTSELICIVKMQDREIPLSKNPKIILLDRPSKHGNLGSIIRSSEAFGFDGIVITGHAIDHYAPEVITASMGSFFNIPIKTLQTNEQFITWIDNLRQIHPTLQCVATTLDGEKNIDEVDFTKPTLLMLGNEGEGLSKFYRENCDCRAKIPMQGEADSFNIACAATVFMYEINRQRNCK